MTDNQNDFKNSGESDNDSNEQFDQFTRDVIDVATRLKYLFEKIEPIKQFLDLPDVQSKFDELPNIFSVLVYNGFDLKIIPINSIEYDFYKFVDNLKDEFSIGLVVNPQSAAQAYIGKITFDDDFASQITNEEALSMVIHYSILAQWKSLKSIVLEADENATVSSINEVTFALTNLLHILNFVFSELSEQSKFAKYVIQVIRFTEVYKRNTLKIKQAAEIMNRMQEHRQQ